MLWTAEKLAEPESSETFERDPEIELQPERRSPRAGLATIQ